MGHLKIIIVIIIVLAIVSCKKNAPYEIPVRGNVRNNCTGKAFTNQTVMLSYDNKLFERTTDSNGDFDFGLITVRPKDKTKFKLGIPENSNNDFEINGITVILTKEEISEFCQFGISASFKSLRQAFPPDFVYNPQDSIDLIFMQRTLREFEPERITEFRFKGKAETGHFEGIKNFFGNINRYPMGLWHVTINKYKSGQYSTVHDSVFIDMGETKTYVIPW